MVEFNPKEFLKGLTSRPGVYRLLDRRGTVLYVGKAGNLKKRVASYFGRTPDSPKTRAMVGQVAGIEVTVTGTEGEALLLESNLIKEYRPRYNVVFRDDKSYPYLYFSVDQAVPRLSFYRGARRARGRYFGPFPSAGAARRTLNLTQKLFRIRQCDDSFYRHRTRPCLQHQIQRCTAPCVGLVSEADYARDVNHAVLFLEGRNEEVIEALTGPMQRAAEAQDYERAAHYRDQIASLRRILAAQHVSAPAGECDIVAVARAAGQACVQVFYVRGGRTLGNKAYFPRHGAETGEAEILGAFLGHHYLSGSAGTGVPPELYVSAVPPDLVLLEALLSERRGAPVRIHHRLRGPRAQWIRMARDNAEVALQQRLALRQKTHDRLGALRAALNLEAGAERIECFDVSHSRGEATVAACVVFTGEGARSQEYRRFNIEGVGAGDDYAALRQAMERRYARVKREDGQLPDLILVDGGKGQLGVARAALAELQLEHLPVMGIAKGPSRRAGLESLVLSDARRTLRLGADSPALHLLQEIRDEAHRFAITGHRRRRAKRRTESPLQAIEGVGPKRRQGLLRHFGGMQGVERAGVEELAKVPGINKNLARKIYDALHG